MITLLCRALDQYFLPRREGQDLPGLWVNPYTEIRCIQSGGILNPIFAGSEIVVIPLPVGMVGSDKNVAASIFFHGHSIIPRCIGFSSYFSYFPP